MRESSSATPGARVVVVVVVVVVVDGDEVEVDDVAVLVGAAVVGEPLSAVGGPLPEPALISSVITEAAITAPTTRNIRLRDMPHHSAPQTTRGYGTAYDPDVDIADQLNTVEARVIGALIEKGATTPDSYPLSTNALMAACNQTTNRDPILDTSEREVDALMLELRQRGLARTLTGAGHRVPKHRHVVDEALGLDSSESAVLAVLLLRGPQTLNEITTRTERYADGPGGDEHLVNAAIDRLAARPEPLAVRLERQPGEREPRIDQLWAPERSGRVTASPAPTPAEMSPSTPPPPAATTDPTADLETRVESLETALAEQTRRLDALLAELNG